MQRTPEPEELMNDPAQALAYARADFAEANQLFVDLVARQAGEDLRGMLLDLGCGPADIPIALAQRNPGLQIDALDGAPAMLELARENILGSSVADDRIRLKCSYLPSSELPQRSYALVASNSLLHHLNDPMVMWQTVADTAMPGGHVVVMDLARPASVLAVDALVETYALNEPDVLRRDFRNSLLAAYTIDEVVDQLRVTGLDALQVTMVSDRHLAVSGRVA